MTTPANYVDLVSSYMRPYFRCKHCHLVVEQTYDRWRDLSGYEICWPGDRYHSGVKEGTA